MKSFLCLALAAASLAAVSGSARADYQKMVLEEKPVAYWRFGDATGAKITNLGSAGNQADGAVSGKVRLNQTGPRPTLFPDFEGANTAVGLDGKDGFVRVKATPEKNPLAFKQGETITIEAWVNPNSFKDGQDIYIIGKGRTKNAGFASNNQNWGLRLRGVGGLAHLSFLFRDARNLPNSDECWHRWVSDLGVSTGDGWHRVVVTYTFGKGDSMRGWIDDEETKGKWDYGGKTDLGPVVDADEVWIGSSQGGQAASTFNGLIDEVAIYRTAPKADKLALRYTINAPATAVAAAINVQSLPKNGVRIEILEHSKSDKSDAPASVGNDSGDDGKPPPAKEVSWKLLPVKVMDEFVQPAFGLGALPTRYNSKGIRTDRSAPFLVRAAGMVALPAGEHRLLLRSHHGARLSVDGRVMVTTPFANAKYSDAEEVPDQAAKSTDGARTLPAGHMDEVATFKSDGAPHLFVLEAFVGGRKLRPEVGELCVGVAGKDGIFDLLSPKTKIPLTDEGWEPFAAAQKSELAERDVVQRRVVSAEEDKYWAKRHEQARKGIKPAPAIPALPAGYTANNAIDRFVAARLAAAKVAATPLLDDDAFLRRVTLDTTGLIPSPEQIAAFKNDRSPDRRSRAINRLLDEPGWADHWVSYWQDVLAENPGMLKPTLNNTGPFRWFIYDSLRDNKPMDRFATELVQMEGSLYAGGAAGFSMASENDVPMAAKAHIVSKAFLGMELQCARCHDAPYHPFKQEELFSLAAMLKRGPEKVPLSSSIPTNANIKIGRLVEVTLAPGSSVKPAWPFAKVSDPASIAGLVRNHEDSREELAALITNPHNERFPKVVVNRVWKRYLGWGIVEPVDDWATKPEASHPELMDWLAREFVVSGYNLKHVARLILNSQAYQRTAKVTSMEVPKAEARLFEAPARRRLSAEQVVDSLFAAVGKSLASEELNQDVDGRRPMEDFNNLGVPKRAWEFCSLANERDRPALALPRAQAIVDTLMMFGWRESRPNPLTVRDDSPNVLQPANLANSTLAVRVVRLSDDSTMTRLALEDRPLPELIRAAFLRVLSRPPTSDELALFTAHLERGYSDRRLAVSVAQKKTGPKHVVSWSNHLNAEATKIKLEQEKEARAGDPPTTALRPEWRERMVWAMVNTPEFVFVP
jgi:hypothetical protein